MLFKSMYIIYVNHDSVIKQICQLRDKAFLINETDVSRETSSATKNEEKRMFSQAS